MTDWLLTLEGTEVGHQLALVLAIVAAVLHAVFGALQKGRYDPWIMRGAIDISYCVIAMPFALFVVPWPEPHMWPIFAGAFVIHVAYKMLQAQAYSLGAFTVVYPVVRGTGPLFTVIAAYFVFSETFAPMQWFGVFVLISGIFGLAGYNYMKTQVDRDILVRALMLACITGGTVALYTTYDAYGIRATEDPFTFLAWFFMIDGLFMPIVAYRHYQTMEEKPALVPLFKRGVIGAFIAFASFGSIMMATRLDKVGEAAVLRETSAVFAAVIGWLFLKETVGPRRLILMGLIATGAVVVELGG
ncbi:EamA family transporter [Cochlodiniinecator piscidefendens]|uniref:EamA family transporter n=1 Tax=Cochlodiniinecator piscidefendens TaxID=2715756 RepID=UPI00140A80E0|nr:EamA family transporter [Cochlodiniinecator piscidefendens]